MNDQLSKLTLERGVTYRRGWRRTAVQLQGLQWAIDGNPIAVTLQEARSALPKDGRRLTTDLHYSVLQRRKDSSGDASRDALRFLLGEDQWEDSPGRVPLIIGECLHLECAVISAVILRRDDVVVWSRFQAHQAGPTEDGYRFPQNITYAFDREQHDSVLREAQARI